jgi:hypothetical protein
MSDTHDRMTHEFAAILEEATASMPPTTFVNIPVGRLVRAAHDVFADAPRPPAYDPETTPKRVFYGAVPATAGHDNDRARVEPSDADYGVRFEMFQGDTATTALVSLPAADAAQFALNILSVVAHQRAEERREATGE